MELSHMHLVDLLSSLKHDYIVIILNSPMNSYLEEKNVPSLVHSAQIKQMTPPQLNRGINNN